ncbi:MULTISPECIES: MetQ/NlpA family ABC transporter substrate-binding protein [Rhizobium/Agrobacterium group]|jgi:D-methionine transport system substrate-binding protein|uniref:MetQ/NlpA family ABC transporter substrate-binding protein n=1 Tax=Rhizobium rhizogenes TaxID=359 RepID=A0AA92C7D1_RHIRH|nr:MULTISPECIES: MetQ/NlpA family ABC transporter substrate-binding protein [Rhizobium/Agrobacterium group]KQR34066.1 metal ABC transporter substrate-binding protein [Rhizobium sp. Leaf155]PVE57270.1 MetQ/NlpA family ABC transporter substrate-binding protein [Rhizobium rhizogenes]PVE68215.1 MetQ/NlpA family ABC transporter substrate-binding protein [Agrobacterium tumefaciens]PVE77963.1 MetQ/NlpA family ABC transporter substrate-binding protein [Sphingomonas sp. TPD3009]
MKKLIIAASLAALFAGSALAETIKVGVTPAEHAQIMEQVKKVAATKGLDIEILDFSDYVVPNQALADGELQANSFQHQPYLDNQIADRKFDIVSVGTTITTPMGVYSKKVKSLDELKDGATVGIPNDPTNGGRALLVLASKGVLKVNDAVGLKVTPADITENPKNIQIVELDAAQLPRSLDDTDASVINTNYATAAGLNPKKDAIAIESEKSPYANVIAVRTEDKDKPWVKTLVESYHSPEVKNFILEKYNGTVIPSW